MFDRIKRALPAETGASTSARSGLSLVRIILSVVALIVVLVLGSNLFENLDAHDIMVVQSVTGNLTFHVEPGPKWQGFGKVTLYPRRTILPFEQQIRFNDNGHGTAKGSVQVEMPIDVAHLTMIHKQYGSAEALQKQLVETVVSKCIYLTGPLMSSKESASEKRNDLLQYIEDQIKHGVYRTAQKDIQIPDPLDDKKLKNVTVVEIVKDTKGQLARVENGALTEYGIGTFNFAIKDLPYDEAVEKQIKEQQKLTMQVQTSIASAKQAEQRALTVAKEGEADAAKARWEQEVLKATAVTQAEQQRDVAKLERDASEFTKQKLILEGQGEATKRQLIMAADGALDKKLEAWKAVNAMYAGAIEKSPHRMTPDVVMGGNGGGGNVGLSLADMLMVKTAKELGLNPNPTGK